LTLFNPINVPVDATIYFQGTNGTIASTVAHLQSGPGRTRIHVNDFVPSGTDVSLVVICQTAGLAAERTMTWQLGADEREGHSSPGVPVSSTDWYFAEGDTGFFTYFPVLNFAGTTSHVQVDYLHANGNLYSQTVDIPPYSRVTVIPPSTLPLGSYGVHLHATTSVAAERSVYGGTNWELGTNGVGSTAPLMNTYLPEGATGSFYDTYILIANPSNTATAHVWLAFINEAGSQPTWQAVTLAPHSRQSVLVDLVPGMSAANFRTEVRSTDIPVVAERVTYWPGVAGSNALGPNGGATDAATGNAGTVSPEPSLGFNPYTTTRPRAPAAALGRYQSVTEGQSVGPVPATTTNTASPEATTNDTGTGWYGAHLTGGRP
jgi:hypothetical protein